MTPDARARRRRPARVEASGSRTEPALGIPRFEYNQWTVEGEIERFGAFGHGITRERGWRRAVGVSMALLILVPAAIALLSWVVEVFGW